MVRRSNAIEPLINAQSPLIVPCDIHNWHGNLSSRYAFYLLLTLLLIQIISRIQSHKNIDFIFS